MGSMVLVPYGWLKLITLSLITIAVASSWSKSRHCPLTEHRQLIRRGLANHEAPAFMESHAETTAARVTCCTSNVKPRQFTWGRWQAEDESVVHKVATLRTSYGWCCTTDTPRLRYRQVQVTAQLWLAGKSFPFGGRSCGVRWTRGWCWRGGGADVAVEIPISGLVTETVSMGRKGICSFTKDRNSYITIAKSIVV